MIPLTSHFRNPYQEVLVEVEVSGWRELGREIPCMRTEFDKKWVELVSRVSTVSRVSRVSKVSRVSRVSRVSTVSTVLTVLLAHLRVNFRAFFLNGSDCLVKVGRCNSGWRPGT